MDVGVVGKETLFVSVVEIGTVVDGCLLCRSAAENLRTPSVPANR